jgi:hypothetical protein
MKDKLIFGSAMSQEPYKSLGLLFVVTRHTIFNVDYRKKKEESIEIRNNKITPEF